MNSWGKKSLQVRGEIHPDLQILFDSVLQIRDCCLLCGYRGQAAQDQAFADGKSKEKYPNSKHNRQPALAVDVCPYPPPENNPSTRAIREQYIYFAGFVMGSAKALKQAGVITHDIRWGGDWNQNNDPSDETFSDLGHFEIMES